MNGSTVRLSDLCELIAEPVRPGTRPDALYLGLEHLASGRLSRIGGGQASDMREHYVGIPDRRCPLRQATSVPGQSRHS